AVDLLPRAPARPPVVDPLPSAADRLPVVDPLSPTPGRPPVVDPLPPAPDRPPAVDRPPVVDLLLWWSPDPRAAIPVGGVHLTRSLRKTLRNSGWTTTVSRRFAAVVQHCRDGRASAWITPALAAAYQELHSLGFAHSIEVWDGDQLIGGNFGVLVGAVFAGESMFHLRADASKVALVDLAFRFRHGGGTLLDSQVSTPHMQRLGAVDIPRDEYLALLDRTRDTLLHLDDTRQPVHRLPPCPTCSPARAPC